MPVARETCNAFKEEVRVTEYLVEDSRQVGSHLHEIHRAFYIKTTSAERIDTDGWSTTKYRIRPRISWSYLLKWTMAYDLCYAVFSVKIIKLIRSRISVCSI